MQLRRRVARLRGSSGLRAFARGSRRVSADSAGGRLRCESSAHHQRIADGTDDQRPRTDDRRLGGMRRGAGIPGCETRARHHGRDDHPRGCRQRGDRRRSSRPCRLPRFAGVRHTIPPVPAGHVDGIGTPSRAPALGREIQRMDHRRRLRQRIPIREPAGRITAGDGLQQSRDLSRNVQQGAVSGLASRLHGGSPPAGGRLPSCP